jgi:hypothetical protein
MVVTVRGWRRVVGYTVLMSVDLRDGYEREIGDGYSRGVTYVPAETNGAVEIHVGPTSLNLSGDYLTVVKLSKEDILELFTLAYHDELSGIIPELTSALQRAAPANPKESAPPRRGTRKKAVRRRRS